MAILLVLQERRRVTAVALAEELEVSVKTARRDLEALATAGIPVYAQPGRGGGWSLLGGARTDLTGLTAAEARALFLLVGPSASVSPLARAALRKLVRALPETFRSDAQAAASAVLTDPIGWPGDGPSSVSHLEPLQQAVVEMRQVRLAYADRRRHETVRTVHPLGLVRKGMSWYLVGNTGDGMRTFLLRRIQTVEILDEPAARPDGFDLAKTWSSMVTEVAGIRRRLHAVVRVPPDILPALRGQLGADLEVLETGNGGPALAEIAGASAEIIAEELAGWGGQLEVISPDEVRHHLARIGAGLVDRYGGAVTPGTQR